MTSEIYILKTYPGHSIFELDLRHQNISIVKDVQTISSGIVKYTPKDSEHWYESALNEDNAFKKFNRKARYIVTGKK